MGVAYLHDGYFTQAIDAWRAAWKAGKNSTDPRVKLIIDRALGELLRLYTSVGQFDNVSAMFTDMGGRHVEGSATEDIQTAREELDLVKKDPRHLFNCGPVALKLLIEALDAKSRQGDFLQFYRAGANGTNMAELKGLADKAKLPSEVVGRTPGQTVPMPAVVHWKVGHYGTITAHANGRYRVEEPGFPGGAIWVTQKALDDEASGYFLVAAHMRRDTAWRAVDVAEAGKIWGKGPTSKKQPGGAGGRGRPCPPSHGMTSYCFSEYDVSLVLTDVPVGYTPPIGPSPIVTLTYYQGEDSQPAVFPTSNVSQKWTMGWINYITDDPTNPGATVSRNLPVGGAFYYTGYASGTGQFAAQFTDGAVLTLTSTSPVTYTLTYADGSTEIYSQSNGATAYPRNVYLTKKIDPQGNTLMLGYDSQSRLTSLTDAAGRVTTLGYTLYAQPLLITQVTDPFGRSATLGYDSSGRLSSITDVLGLTSSFLYDVNSLIYSMTTPYGTTGFTYTAPGASGPPRFLQVTDPLGLNERMEWLEPAPIPDSDPAATVPTNGTSVPFVNQYLTYRDTFYWDKNAYTLAGCTPTGGCDYTKAVDDHFLHFNGQAIKSTTIESTKKPLENRVWYLYPGQTQAYSTGTWQQPSTIARVLDDGTTQTTTNAYDTTGYFNLTQTTDPVGRITSYSYPNHIDLTAVTRTVGGGVQQTLDAYTYFANHRPMTHTDVAGQTTNYTYNTAGQLKTVTDPLNEVTTANYNATGDLLNIVNANNLTQASYTYDAYDRVATVTDSEGWVVTYSYDAADRVTKVSYPDGTSESRAYTNLDLTSVTDRIGRVWAYVYDADRRLMKVTDPAGQATLFGYNGIGEVTSRQDPKGNITRWAYDVEGRLTQKTYADTTTLTYAYETTTSRLHSTTDALSQVKQYSYAQDNLIMGLTYLSALHTTPNVSFVYDPYFARRTSMTDGTGTTTYAYYPVGVLGALKMSSETPPPASGTINYTYDKLMRLATRQVTGSALETFSYDPIGRTTGDTNDLGAFTLGYLGQTNQTTTRSLTGTTLATTWSYLPNSGDRRLSGIATTGLSAGQSTAFTYVTNPVNQTTGQTQVSDASVSDPAAGLAQTASYNTLNQLTTLSGNAQTFDADGNLTADATRTYAWDAENRLVGIGYLGLPTKATAFAYDGLGRRTSISSTPAGGAKTTTTYLWCGSWPCQARNAANVVIKAYYRQGEYAPGGAITSAYYAPDRVGSVRRVFASTSTVPYDYDAFGNPLQGTAPTTDYVYAGMFNNPDSGLYLTPSRVYDPVGGRWLSRDPFGEVVDAEGNLYPYGDGDPVNNVDPTGLLASPQLGGYAESKEIYENLPDALCDYWPKSCVDRLQSCAKALCFYRDRCLHSYSKVVTVWTPESPSPGDLPSNCSCLTWKFRNEK